MLLNISPSDGSNQLFVLNFAANFCLNRSPVGLYGLKRFFFENTDNYSFLAENNFNSMMPMERDFTESCVMEGSGLRLFHISTRGIESSLFLDDADYVKMIDIAGIFGYRNNVIISAYCFMSNHIHMSVAAGSEDDAVKFIQKVKQCYSGYFRRAHGVGPVFREVPVSVKRIDSLSYFRNCIAYILRNPVEAGLVRNADLYRWSSFGCYFRRGVPDISTYVSETSSRLSPASQSFDRPSLVSPTSASSSFTRLSSASLSLDRSSSVSPTFVPLYPASGFIKRRLRRLLRTHIDMTGSRVAITEDGHIDPSSFVDYAFVEKCFWNSSEELSRAIAKVNYYAVEYELSYFDNVSLQDSALFKAAASISVEWFGKELPLLDLKERTRMIRTLNSRYNANSFQISRILGLDRKMVEDIMK